MYSGFHYFLQGWRLITLPGIRRFVILPLLTNIVIMGGAFWWLFAHLKIWIARLMTHVPHWLHWLDYLIWPLAVFSILLVSGYFFSTLTNIIASPFNGLLAEKLEQRLSAEPLADNAGWLDLLADTPRILKREMQKLFYYLPRALVLLLLYLIPGFGQTLAPFLWLLFSAWMVAIQYCDYPFDNHKVKFPVMRQMLGRHRASTLTFGCIVNFCTLIPLLNLVIMPVAVCGATAMWVDRYRQPAALAQRDHLTPPRA